MANPVNPHLIIQHVVNAITLGEKLLLSHKTKFASRPTVEEESTAIASLQAIDFTLHEEDLADRYETRFHLPPPHSQVPDNTDFHILYRFLSAFKWLHQKCYENSPKQLHQEYYEYGSRLLAQLNHVTFGLVVCMISIVLRHSPLAHDSFYPELENSQQAIAFRQRMDFKRASSELLSDIQPLHQLYCTLYKEEGAQTHSEAILINGQLNALVVALENGKLISNPSAYLYELIGTSEVVTQTLLDGPNFPPHPKLDLRANHPEELLRRIERMMELYRQRKTNQAYALAEIRKISFEPPLQQDSSSTRWTLSQHAANFEKFRKAVEKLQHLYLLASSSATEVDSVQQIVIAYALNSFASTSRVVLTLTSPRNPMQLSAERTTPILPRATMPTFLTDLQVIERLAECKSPNSRLNTFAEKLSELCKHATSDGIKLPRESSYTDRRVHELTDFLTAMKGLNFFLEKHKQEVGKLITQTPIPHAPISRLQKMKSVSAFIKSALK